jgi:hypothetical protein
MTYRTKSCKYCGIDHKKRGPFCSKICSNKNRTHSDETKAKMSASQSVAQRVPEVLEKTWHQRTKAQLKSHAMHRKENLDNVELEPDNVYLPPMRPTLPTTKFVQDGDLWEEVE